MVFVNIVRVSPNVLVARRDIAMGELSCHSGEPLIVNNSVPEVLCWVIEGVFKLGCQLWEPFTVNK